MSVMPACHKVLQPIDIIESPIQLNQCHPIAIALELVQEQLGNEAQPLNLSQTSSQVTAPGNS
jgi:hypothetical protein